MGPFSSDCVDVIGECVIQIALDYLYCCGAAASNPKCLDVVRQWLWKLKNFDEDRNKKFGVGLPPQNLISFGPFVHCLLTILLLFLIFLSFSWFFLIIFLPPQNFRGNIPLPENFRGGDTSPAPHWCNHQRRPVRELLHEQVKQLRLDAQINMLKYYSQILCGGSAAENF